MSENKEQKQNNNVDKELDDLLDSALQDMTKPKVEAAEPTEVVETSTESNLWSDQFIQEAAAQFESNMAAILGSISGVPEDQISQDQIAATFSKMAEAAAQVMQQASPQSGTVPETAQPIENQESVNDMTAAITETLKNLNASSDNLQTPFTDQDLANMFNNFNLEGQQEGGPNMFVPFMQGMMQSLLSKEVLYPSLKDLLDKYPAWLDDNKDKIDSNDLDRFKKQEELMRRVCEALEDEKEDDLEDVKRRRFETVLELMQKMQDLGQPPTELVGDLGLPPAGFQMPQAQEGAQCCIA